MIRSIFRFLHRISIGNWRAIDREWREQVSAPAAAEAPAPSSKKKGKRKRRKDAAKDAAPVEVPAKFDWRPVIVLVTVAISLTLQEYIGERDVFSQWFPDQMVEAGKWAKYGQLKAFAWWTGWRVLGYVVLPIIAIWCMPGERVRDNFISLKNFFKHLPIYAVLFMIVLPFVILASRTQSFYLTYPFYKWANRSSFDLWAWECMYAIQFFSLEFFFRGFILKSLAPRMGSAAIFVMVVPYNMIHYGKPMAETFGAIIAGTVLGTLALRTKSIWGGVVIHVGVALTMDLLAVGHCPPAASGQMCPSHFR